jgi:hypothetical protein
MRTYTRARIINNVWLERDNFYNKSVGCIPNKTHKDLICASKGWIRLVQFSIFPRYEHYKVHRSPLLTIDSTPLIIIDGRGMITCAILVNL